MLHICILYKTLFLKEIIRKGLVFSTIQNNQKTLATCPQCIGPYSALCYHHFGVQSHGAASTWNFSGPHGRRNQSLIIHMHTHDSQILLTIFLLFSQQK